jgi:Putative integrase
MAEEKTRKYDGRSTELTFSWLTRNHGQEWEEWRVLAAQWMEEQEKGVGEKLEALNLFFQIYLVNHATWASSYCVFFEGTVGGWRASTEEFKDILLKNTNRSDNHGLVRCINYVVRFIDWVLENHFSERNDNGDSERYWVNPLSKLKSNHQSIETVYNPLPYRYICDLRHILCTNSRGNFSDWTWAHEQTGHGNQSGDWFEVAPNLIDKSDLDCVWREKKVNRNNKKIVIYQLWSPVTAMVLFIKLYLPLRTYQVRMLDSGEADSLRYVGGEWAANDRHSFALHQLSKGVFRRYIDNATGLISTGLYINTNKTADQNKDELKCGYEIPWQNEDVLYWLEKLRNWQEKYNPISQPTNCTTLLTKHTKSKRSVAYLASMGHICFLMRNASATSVEDRKKPIQDSKLRNLWYKLLAQLESNLKTSGETLSDGTALRLAHDYGDDYKGEKKKTEFPPHSLRVSLITCYAMDAKVPLPIISKLLAGHSRLLMTVYYTKLTPAVMKEKMEDADKQLEDKSKQSVRTFLKDASMRQIRCKVA